MNAKVNKRIIWTSEINVDDWRDGIKEFYPDEELTEDEIYELACEENNVSLNFERENLNKELENSLVMFGTLGLWYGTRSGWKILKDSNLNGVFSRTCGDIVTWYVEDGDIRCEDIHHDGTNNYTYRMIKPELGEWEFEELMADGADINTLTVKLGDYVNDVYGWR